MKKLFFLGAVIAGALSVAFYPADKEELEILAIGAKAPMTDVAMQATSGEMQTLADLKGKNGLAVIFSCNTCPFVVGAEGYGEGWETRYNELSMFAKRYQTGIVLVNSNEAKRDGDDSFDEMKAHAEAKGYTMPYVVDKNSALADAFGARTTPHVFLFNADMELIYKGAIDDNNKSAKEVKEKYLREAMEANFMGKEIKENSTRQMGCSIKRVK